MKPTILEEIVANKKLEVAKRKELLAETDLIKKERNRAHYSLKNNILQPNSSGIIAEFKRKSPSKGWLFPNAVVAEIVFPYQEAGVSGISILTDQNYFGGTDADVLAANALKIPIIRKEFIVDPYQIYEANQMGADVVLLIASVLTPHEVKHYISICKEVGLETLLEIHNEDELAHICEGIDMVGVNNRNLHSFDVDLDHSIRLAKQIPDSFVKIAESGISSLQDIIRLKQQGFRGFLIGEYFMKTPDPGKTCQQLIEKLTNTI